MITRIKVYIKPQHKSGCNMLSNEEATVPTRVFFAFSCFFFFLCLKLKEKDTVNHSKKKIIQIGQDILDIKSQHNLN